MDKDFGICGREKEIKAINNFISEHVDQNEAGILYLTGPPGTGKTMSVSLVLNKVKDIKKLHMNCFKVASAKVALTKLCQALDIKVPSKSCEPVLISLITKKLTGRTCKPFLLVLDEMDQLPKSNNINLFRTIFSWTDYDHSKLIIIGIANTVNLTARSQAFATFVGSDDKDVEKIIFKPYSSRDIEAILHWYLENDENLEEASVEPKVIELISKKIAREKGDIRSAIDNLRDAVYDTVATSRIEIEQKTTGPLATPPATPPLTPCKQTQRTNLASAVKSAKKRQRESHYFDEQALPASEVVLLCLMKFCGDSKDASVDLKMFSGRARDILMRYGTNANQLDLKGVIEQLEMQGTISIKKTRGRMISDKIVLNASENEISRLCQHKYFIENHLSRYA